MTTSSAPLKDRVAEAQARLDAHVREIVQWHFSPETGCPFWLDHAARLDFDPREKVQVYDDLKHLKEGKDAVNADPEWSGTYIPRVRDLLVAQNTYLMNTAEFGPVPE